MKHLDPKHATTSPYDPDRVAPPTSAELVQMGLAPASDEKAIQVTTKVRPEIVYTIDRLIERGVYNLKSRHEVFRLALMNLVKDLVDDVQQEHVRSMVYRLESQRRLYGEILQMRHIAEMIGLTRKTVRLFLQYGNQPDAIKALRNAKRYMEEIPFEGLREKFSNMLYGSESGDERPEGWDEMESAVLWDKVVEGELDRDDDEEVRARMKVY